MHKKSDHPIFSTRAIALIFPQCDRLNEINLISSTLKARSGLGMLTAYFDKRKNYFGDPKNYFGDP